MVAHRDTDRASIPTNSLIFGYGPMIPFVVAAVGAWTLPQPWPALAIRLAVIWGALIAVFVAGVRRGFGFGRKTASTRNEIATMLVYFVPAGLALVASSFGRHTAALLLLAPTFALIAILDRAAAHAGNAPAYFARLRVPQMTIAVVALAVLAAR